MKLYNLTGATTQILEIDQNSQGILFSAINKTAKIKVDQVGNNIADSNRIPEMLVSSLAEIMAVVSDGSYQIRESTTELINFKLLFSTRGILPLNEDSKYRVTITLLDDSASYDVFNLDHANQVSRGLIISKAEVRSTFSEKVVNTTGVSLLYFPNVSPLKVSYFNRTNNRKVDYSIEQINASSLKLVTQTGSLPASAYLGQSKPSLKVGGISELTVHHDTALEQDLIYYMVSTLVG
ncbi:hypothetical protein [Joostella sp.]|uniref:hypothetical protein n=1 Tax=Joostella sp. TaxID=2231138 RepID=UPI003A932157